MVSINKKIKAKELKDGDIFYIDTIDVEANNWIGEDVFLTGSDMILIVDDCSAISECSILVNGGFDLAITPEDEVYIIGHYSNILESIKKL